MPRKARRPTKCLRKINGKVCGSTDLLVEASKPFGVRACCKECHARSERESVVKRHATADPGGIAKHGEPSKFDELTDRVRVLLLQKNTEPWTVEALADRIECPPFRIREAVETLHDAKLNLQMSDAGGLWISELIPKSAPDVIPLTSLKGKEVKFGLTADNHLCSKYSRLDVLNALFDMWEDEGIETVYCCGNWIDGEARFNKGDLLVFGIEGQLDYFVENWPQRKGITTKFISGDDHEGWYTQREHIDIGRYAEEKALKAGRHDLKYLGYMEHDIIFIGSGAEWREDMEPEDYATMRLIHAGGGSSYAISYKTQKILESYQGGEKPKILLVGHYHKFEQGYPRETHVVQAGCTQDQTPFLRKRNIQAMVGGVTVSFKQHADSLVHGFTVKWEPFYDRGFYRRWGYRWRNLHA